MFFTQILYTSACLHFIDVCPTLFKVSSLRNCCIDVAVVFVSSAFIPFALIKDCIILLGSYIRQENQCVLLRRATTVVLYVLGIYLPHPLCHQRPPVPEATLYFHHLCDLDLSKLFHMISCIVM